MDEPELRRVYDGSYRRLAGQLSATCGDLTEAEDVVFPLLPGDRSAPADARFVCDRSAWGAT